MAALIDDDLLSAFVVEGSFDDLPALLAARYGGVARRLVLYFAGAAWAQDRAFFERCGEVARELRRLTGEAAVGA
jgi:hypothetical protein